MIRVTHLLYGMKNAGMENFLMNMYRNLDRTKVQFDFLCYNSEKGYFDKEITALGGKVCHLGKLKKNNIGHAVSNLLKGLEKNIFLGRQIDILHIHTAAAKSYLYYKAARQANIANIIVHSHSSNCSAIRSKLLHMCYKPALAKSDAHKFACSKKAGVWLFGKNEYKKGNVRIIKNAIDVGKFKFNDDARNTLRKECGCENKFVIGHIGRFDKQKNHEFLIDIFHATAKLRPESELWLVGTGALETGIREKVKALGIEDRVKFLGVRDNVNDYMQAMDVFLLPSLYEGLPVVMVEAQASGLKCFASESISKEAKIAGQVEFLPLKKGAKHWAQQIVNTDLSHSRENAYQKVIDAGFDIKEEVKKLQEFYLGLSQSHEN